MSYVLSHLQAFTMLSLLPRIFPTPPCTSPQLLLSLGRLFLVFSAPRMSCNSADVLVHLHHQAVSSKGEGPCLPCSALSLRPSRESTLDKYLLNALHLHYCLTGSELVTLPLFYRLKKQRGQGPGCGHTAMSGECDSQSVWLQKPSQSPLPLTFLSAPAIAEGRWLKTWSLGLSS